jgi:hypothetical protein
LRNGWITAMIRQAPIEWSKLPHAQRQRLIVLLGQLVEQQLATAGMGEERADERLPLADPPFGGPPGQREDPAVASAAPGGVVLHPDPQITGPFGEETRTGEFSCW